jgi:hypothetical protein
VTSSERIATVAALITAGLGLALIIGPPFVWFFVALLMVTACVGTHQVLRGHPRLSATESSFAAFVLPTLIVLGGSLFLRLPNFVQGPSVALGLLATGGLFTAALYAEYQSYDVSGRRSRAAKIVLNLIAYLIAFVLFSAIFAPKFRSLLSATAVLLASALISVVLFRDSARTVTHPLWAGVVALTMGQVTWALNYWVLGPLAGGAILLLIFYTLTGLVRSYLNSSLVSRVLTEHLIVAGAGLTAVIAGGLWLR